MRSGGERRNEEVAVGQCFSCTCSPHFHCSFLNWRCRSNESSVPRPILRCLQLSISDLLIYYAIVCGGARQSRLSRPGQFERAMKKWWRTVRYLSFQSRAYTNLIRRIVKKQFHSSSSIHGRSGRPFNAILHLMKWFLLRFLVAASSSRCPLRPRSIRRAQSIIGNSQ